MKKRRLYILAAVLSVLLAVTALAAAQGGLPQLGRRLPDPADILGTPGEVYDEHYVYNGKVYRTYLYDRPAPVSTFLSAYMDTAVSMGFSAEQTITEGYKVLKIISPMKRDEPALLFYDYQGFMLLMVPENMGFIPSGSMAVPKTEPTPPPAGVPGTNAAELAQKGEDAYWAEDYETALAYLIPAADMGNSDAQFRLGYMYERGFGVVQSYKMAVKYYQLAADQGSIGAQNNLGVMYDHGYGVAQSYEMAVKYFQMAADQGNARAQCNLGYMYEDGHGVPQSYEIAVKYYQLAADQGDKEGQCNLGYMYEAGLGVAQSYETALKYYQLSADQGYARGQYYLGDMYEYGKGVTRSIETALKYYRLAAAQGYQYAADRITVLTSPTGTPVPTKTPTRVPTKTPTRTPTRIPTKTPTRTPTRVPTKTPTRTPTRVPTKTPVPSYYKGQNIKFGSYDGRSIEWQVLDVRSDRILVISRYGLDAKAYNNVDKDVTWENCSLRTWLNGTFYNTAFSAKERNRIIEVLNSNPNNREFGTNGGRSTYDRVFVLSIDEVNQYMPNNSTRRCEPIGAAKRKVNVFNGYAFWWLRSPSYYNGGAAVIHTDGRIDYNANVGNSAIMVRPVMWIRR